jgi:hypothetical protein
MSRASTNLVSLIACKTSVGGLAKSRGRESGLGQTRASKMRSERTVHSVARRCVVLSNQRIRQASEVATAQIIAHRRSRAL